MLFIFFWALVIGLFDLGREKWMFIGLIIILSGMVYQLCVRIRKVALDDKYLYVSNYIKEIRIPLPNINKVSENYLTTPKLIHIAFKDSTTFGKKISFIPQADSLFSPYKSHHIVDEILDAKAMSERV